MTLLPGSPSSPGGSRLPIDRKSLHDHWKGLVAFGVVLVALGVLALVLTVSATIASVLTIGIFMLLAGGTEIAMGFRVRSWQRFALWEIAGITYLLAGLFAVLAPEVATVVLTLLLGAGLVATGVLRLVNGLRVRASASHGLLPLSGAVTALLGLFIVLGWPGNSPFILGTLLGIDLVFNGVMWAVFGLRARAPV